MSLLGNSSIGFAWPDATSAVIGAAHTSFTLPSLPILITALPGCIRSTVRHGSRTSLGKIETQVLICKPPVGQWGQSQSTYVISLQGQSEVEAE